MAITSLDIELVESNDLTKIKFADSSIYSIIISNPSFEITTPGFNKVSVIFTPNSVNIYDATNLNIDCSDESVLPDGIYTVKYSIAPNLQHFVEKSFIRTTAIKCKFANIFLALDTNCNCGISYKKELKMQLRDIKELIEGAIASSNQCDQVSAMNKYKLADQWLDRIKVCNC